MINRIINTATLLFLLISSVYSQETITADKNSGCDSLQVLFTLNTSLQQSDYTSIQWSFGDGDSASATLTASHMYNSPGTYTVSCTLNGTTVIEETNFISMGFSPYADFIFIDSSDSETDYTYFFQTAYYQPPVGETIDYEWGFPDGSTASDSTAIYTFPEEGIYEISLVLTDKDGCADSILRKIPVSHELMPPNVFTPNGDGINDYFEVGTQGDYRYSFRIFTPSGTQVYFSQSSKIVWDGRTIGGREVPEGVYYFVIESSDTPVETELTGFIHLYR